VLAYPADDVIMKADDSNNAEILYTCRIRLLKDEDSLTITFQVVNCKVKFTVSVTVSQLVLLLLFKVQLQTQSSSSHEILVYFDFFSTFTVFYF